MSRCNLHDAVLDVYKGMRQAPNFPSEAKRKFEIIIEHLFQYESELEDAEKVIAALLRRNCYPRCQTDPS